MIQKSAFGLDAIQNGPCIARCWFWVIWVNVRIEYGLGINGLGEVLEEVLDEVLEGRCNLDQILADFEGMVRWLHELLFISRENSELGLKLWYEVETEIKGKRLSFSISKSGAELPPPFPLQKE